MNLLLADSSAWHRSRSPNIAALWAQRLGERRVATCAPIRLEVLCSAQSAKDYGQISEELDALAQTPCGTAAFERALEVQAALARRRALHHRIPIQDLVIAAAAELAGDVVWHYDNDYERISEITGQKTEWIAKKGSL